VPRRNATTDDSVITIAGRRYEGHAQDIEEQMRERMRELDEENADHHFTEAQAQEFRDLDFAVQERNFRRERIAELANYREDGAAFDDNRGTNVRPSGEIRSQALRANESASFLPDKSREHMEQQIREDDDPNDGLARATGALSDRAYYRAFAKWMNDPESGRHEWTDKEREAVQKVRWMQRSLTLSTAGTGGGLMVPYELDPSIILAGVGAVDPLRQISRVVSTAVNEKRFVTSTGVQLHWDPEETQSTDDSPTLLQPTVVCKKGAGDVVVSYELFGDSDLAQQIGNVFADAKTVWESLSVTLTQTNGPVGLITALVAAGGSTVIATGTNVFATADLYANQAALPARWQANSSWMMHLATLNAFRQLPQATGLTYSIVTDDTTPPTILGRPAYVNSSTDATLSGGAADYLVLNGDFSQCAIVDRIGSTLEILPGTALTRGPPGRSISICTGVRAATCSSPMRSVSATTAPERSAGNATP
jgi:HK97 family phage major capsid protein